MKRKYVLIGAVLLLAFALFSYFHVDGRELKPVVSLTENYTCIVTKTKDTLDGLKTDYTLSGEQVLLLRDLILNSSFTRIPSNSYSYHGYHDSYSFLLELWDGQRQMDFLQMYYVEDLYFRINAPYHELYITLKIRDPRWHKLVESILDQS